MDGHFLVCIIGAGTSGINAAKQLLHDQHVDSSRIRIIEETGLPGGVWNSVQRNVTDQNDVCKEPDICEYSGSPMPDLLTTNLPKDTMAFTDLQYPALESNYPSHTAVQQYLASYCAKFVDKDCILYNTTVRRLHKDGGDGVWILNCLHKNMDSDKVSELSFTADYVMVCSGHYRYPFVPSVQFNQKEIVASRCLRCVLHSSAFRHPVDYKHSKKILIVGSRASAADIGNQLLRHGKDNQLKQEIFVSMRGEMISAKKYLMRGLLAGGVVILKNIKNVDCVTGDVSFDDGHTETQIDTIIFATGYLYKYPFLESVADYSASPCSVTPCSGAEGPKVLAHHRIACITDPTLLFVGTPGLLFSPAIIIEYQNRYATMLICGKIKAPGTMSEDEFSKLSETEREEFRLASDLGVLGSVSYCSRLARVTASKGYLAQLLFPRLYWLAVSLFLKMFEQLIHPVLKAFCNSSPNQIHNSKKNNNNNDSSSNNNNDSSSNTNNSSNSNSKLD
jgi:hypothetical protein